MAGENPLASGMLGTLSSRPLILQHSQPSSLVLKCSRVWGRLHVGEEPLHRECYSWSPGACVGGGGAVAETKSPNQTALLSGLTVRPSEAALPHHSQPRINLSHREGAVVSAPDHRRIHGNMSPGQGG